MFPSLSCGYGEESLMPKESNKETKRAWLFEATASDIQVKLTLRELSKWVLDFLRNLIVVGAIKFMATKSDSMWLTGLSWVSYGALYIYLFTYLQYWSPRLDIGKNKWIQGVLYFTLSLGLVVFVTVTNVAFTNVIDQVAKVQAK
jgi:hypothetical protein